MAVRTVWGNLLVFNYVFVSFLTAEVDNDLGDSRQRLDEILCERPISQVKLILEEFKRQNDDKSLEKVVRDELDGDLKNAYVNMSEYKQFSFRHKT